jgi:starvation-inducible DNA-binding protein
VDKIVILIKSNLGDIIMEQSIPAGLATPTDLKKPDVNAISIAINPLIADAFALYVKTKNYHWHMSGPHFRDYHLLLDEQAEQILAIIDPLAERVRKLGGTTIRSIENIASLQHVQDDNDKFVKPQEMLKRLMKDNREFTVRLRAAHKVCDDHHDVATVSLLEVYIDEAERRTWFLFEAQKPE